MVITIGGKEHKQGVSKAGKPYDFIVIHFLAPKKGVIGQACCEKLLDPGDVSFDDILVQQQYEIETDLDGNIVAMIPARP